MTAIKVLACLLVFWLVCVVAVGLALVNVWHERPSR